MSDIIHGKVCTITENNINVKDSYTITDRNEMNEMLCIIHNLYPECKVFQVRKWKNLIQEWCAHNLLYNLSYKPDQTGSVDLDTGEPWWRRVLYTILSWFY